MAASYPTATKSFTTKTDGPSSTIFASHINDVQDEIVAIENDLRDRLPSGQVKFPAAQSASADANTLDDYEEGTWTPADGSGAGLALTVNGTAQYVKAGQFVIASGAVTYPATADGTSAKVSGLPFTAQNTTTNHYAAAISFTNYGTAITGLVDSNGTGVTFWNFSGVQISNANLSGKIVRFTAVYRASA